MPQVVAIDGSHHSATVLDWALDHATKGEEVVAMLVWNLDTAGGLENRFGNEEDWQNAAVQRARSIVDSVTRARWTDQRPSVPVRIDVRHGDPCAEIVRASHHSDLIVLGGYRQTQVGLGSVAGCVVPHAHCPVVLVPLTTERLVSSVARPA